VVNAGVIQLIGVGGNNILAKVKKVKTGSVQVKLLHRESSHLNQGKLF
jgi:hypothetical protein